MTNPDRDPRETIGTTGDVECGIEVLTPRDVPLGGPRAMRVRRTLPQRERSLIGAWCFVDHYGPDQVAESGGMVVAPHPHTGLATVSWLFEGEVEHRDSAGNHAMVRPGEVNLMTAGQGISHSEVSPPSTTVLHGVQLWVALPEASRHVAPHFAHHAPRLVTGRSWQGRVFLGSLLGETSPVPTYTPLLGAELHLDAGATLEIDVDETYELGFLVDRGTLHLDEQQVTRDELAYVAPGRPRVSLVAGDEPVRVVVLGGPPFGEQIVMWWNFVGRSHEEIVVSREEWQHQVEDITDGREVRAGRFGIVADEPLAPIPAPALPNARLRSRG